MFCLVFLFFLFKFFTFLHSPYYYQMASRLVWTEEEDKSLKFLKEDSGIEDWDRIAFVLNQNYGANIKTPKDCKSRYEKFAKYFGILCKWTQEEDNVLFNLLIDKGCAWTEFLYFFPNKSQNSIKNRFYNLVRKVTNRLKLVLFKFKVKNPDIDRIYLTRLLEVIGKVEKTEDEIFQKIESGMNFKQMKKTILYLIFHSDKMLDEELFPIIIKLRTFNRDIRSFGIFKVKHIKSWKVSDAVLFHLLKSSQDLNPGVKCEQE